MLTDKDRMDTERRFVISPVDRLGRAIRASLTPDLLKPEYRHLTRPYAGHCYVATEAYYHMSGGASSGLKPRVLRHEGSTHWCLARPDGELVDLTAEQFETPVPYQTGKHCPFQASTPSARARELIRRALAADPSLAAVAR
jgi:hypothetical protein